MKSSIVEVINEICPYDDISEETLLVTEGILNSLKILVLVGQLEYKFNVVISENEVVLENFYNLNSIYKLINDKL